MTCLVIFVTALAILICLSTITNSVIISLTKKRTRTPKGAYMTKTTTLKKFIKINGKTVGLVIATHSGEGLVTIGWSACAGNDVFDKRRAEQIALGRVDIGSTTVIPKHILPEVLKMNNRAHSFFKGAAVEIAGTIVEDWDKFHAEQNLIARLHKIERLKAELAKLEAHIN